MSLSNITVPFIQKQGYLDTEVPQNKILLKKIITDYKKYVDPISELTNVPKEFIYTIIYIESNGKPNAVGGVSIGLMQISTVSAGDVITLENMKKRLSAEEKAKLITLLGTAKTNNYTSRANLGVTPTAANAITNADLLKPEVNIMLGTIYLGLLLDKYTESGIIRFDKMIWGYNVGYFSKPIGTTVDQVHTNAPAVTKNYIVKAGGIKGILTYFDEIAV